MNGMRSIHPGAVLKEEFLEPMGLSSYAVAKAIHVPPNRILAITKAERAITAETALKLGKYFGTSAEFWMNLQQAYDLKLAAQSIELGSIEQVA